MLSVAFNVRIHDNTSCMELDSIKENKKRKNDT